MNLKLPGNLKTYDGTERPDTWIEDYYNAVTFAGGTPNISCRMLQLYLVGPARIWLSDLEKNSLLLVRPEDRLRKALQGHLQKTCHNKRLTSINSPYQQKKNRDNGNSSSHKRKNPDDQKSGGSEMVAMAFQRGGSGGGRGRGRGGGAGRGQQHGTEVTAGGSRAPQTYEEYRDMPCLAHLDPVTGKSTHTNRNCKWVNDLKNDPEAGYKQARKHRPRGKGGKGKNKDKEEDSSEAMDEDDNSPDPKAGSAVCQVVGSPVPKECYALVVSPRIDGYDFSKCLMDGGASLNIMYLETLERMNLTKEQLKHSTTEFHGMVPGKKANSLGSITLPVAFGDVHNFREEKITFEVVPFKSSYHVIFGRPTYHKFHARACYIYNKLKIPGPKGATYQRTMQRCLKDQIGRNVHAYVDDIAVMTRKGSDLISDLTETFENLRRGIEVNPEKIKAILCIKRPTCLKDVQRLTGCVAAISRFVSRLGEKALPLYKLLKKTDKFVWDEAADAALQGLKDILTSPPILAAPGESEPMLLYLAATNKVISLVIVVERQEEGHEYGVQRPVYYISEVLTESKQRYPHFQKLAYGVFLGSRKLRHYFQEHPVTVVSKAPLSTILNNADATGRTAKWGIELSAFDINYKARTAVKSQVLADFVADWTEAPDMNLEPEPETWVMHFDGSKQHQGSGAGVTLKSPTGEELQYVLQIHFEATNNMAEYEALLHGLRIAKEIGIKHIICCGDSDLVAQQEANSAWNFPGASPDTLVKGANPENQVAVSPAREVMTIIPAWTQPFLDYLIDQKLPKDEVLARQIIRRARSYTIVDGQLYKRSATGVFLKCVSNQDGIEILVEIHAGDCGHHAAPRSLIAKDFRLGFYWLTAIEDADNIVKTCRGCQYYATQPNAPAQELKTIPITWPFAVWGLDMVGKLKRSSPGGFEYLLVAADKFSKWIEAKPVRKADGAMALKFVCSLVMRFGIPHSIITDNGTNFAQGELKDYCETIGIRLDLASVAHPQSNGQVERANGLILSGIKPRLEEPLRRAAGAWADE
ncbi:hypothetical protein QYE76_015979 [Lolium multiflorum]|uniref:Integrase catalytic domain-containing protein n=1 Tax=Lolium multiflorum TaxID=4521 RepID=A0AAD8U7X0_LOLMU|nr:hypothetical protein QYE76_015979 [Lolium multiflorum]